MTNKITDSGARAVLALRAMEANAFRVSQVTTRLLDERTDLPELIAVRPTATATDAMIDLQPLNVDDARQWAASLGIELEIKHEADYLPGWWVRRSCGRTVIDGVTVFVVTSETYSPEEWAALQAAEAVTA
ncbi:hypothetical protein ACJ6WF_15935 [Streptomyces sp. MMS24-I2-30]|uniref:hypothetical protein n=1 Tax=Streptomyces sp. MMS24-I2-30 TaxID=3351564 RepID=UPI003896D55F